MANKLINIYESSTETPMDNISLSSFRLTRKEQLKVCCKPTYRMRKLRNKGAIVVLIINYLVISLFYYLNNYKTIYIYMTWGLAIPLVGWLADVCIGRHKMIRWSIWIMWVTFLLATISSLAAQLVESYTNTNRHITLALSLIAAVASGSFHANIIQFGLDQLQDASTDEITSFISWYVWTVISGGIIVDYTLICTNESYHILKKLLVCFCLSIAVILYFSSDNTLIKEPVTQNPFKLVYQVIKYAIKNKQPRCRSAFTYCEDDFPSRIDFGKNKYGGPFTTEQVEDVKTFFRLLPIILLGCTLGSSVFVVNQLSNESDRLIYSNIIDQPISVCYLNEFYAYMAFYTVSALIPLHELFFYPVLRKHFSWVKSHHKISLSALLQMARVIMLMAFILKARHTSLEHSGYNSTVQCIFQEDKVHVALSIDIKWMILPKLLESLSIVALLLGAAEFICCQTPYSMRGLMFGVMFGSSSLFTLIGYGLTQPLRGKLIVWGTGTISCEFWYLLLNTIFLGIVGTSFTILGKLYTRRKREDVLPNEQIFAERYYATDN